MRCAGVHISDEMNSLQSCSLSNLTPSVSAASLALGDLSLQDKAFKSKVNNGAPLYRNRKTCEVPTVNINDGILLHKSNVDKFDRIRCYAPSHTPYYSAVSVQSLYLSKRRRKIPEVKQEQTIDKTQKLLKDCPGTSYRTVIKLREDEKYWSVDENGVITTESFFRNNKKKSERSWFSVMFEFVTLFCVVMLAFVFYPEFKAVLIRQMDDVYK
uniref:Uncharacterized protein n=1 Tax=Aplanochytrium stocchinoi TaxID=215587 RepID=A0A7S3LHH9_9STRA|mmetsp:Transcript_19593/g.23797  ORF Transcript_19593/g.23797 Transcript_19593/m.23797 type:complete len:213 (+) Transcript_19593:44-682(+)